MMNKSPLSYFWINITFYSNDSYQQSDRMDYVFITFMIIIQNISAALDHILMNKSIDPN